jgi:hypothetical protein
MLIGTAYLLGGVSAAIISSTAPGQDAARWGPPVFSLGLLLALVLTVLLVYRVRLDYPRLLLPWYGIPYQVWLIGSPPRHEGLGAAVAYVLGTSRNGRVPRRGSSSYSTVTLFARFRG